MEKHLKNTQKRTWINIERYNMFKLGQIIPVDQI